MLTARKIIDAELSKRRKEGWNQGRTEEIAQGIAKSVKQTIKQMIKLNFKNDIIK